jgi:dihydrofolate reductase
MTFEELAEVWGEFPKRGRILFLFSSRVMRTEHQDGNGEFADALDRYVKADFGDLPWALQDEFGVYAETTFFEKWMRGGEIDDQTLCRNQNVSGTGNAV